MTDDVQIVTREPQYALAVPARASMLSIPRVMGKSFQTLSHLLEQRGLKLNAPPYALYKNIDWQGTEQSRGLSAWVRMFTFKWEIEIGIPAGRYLQTRLTGPYKEVGKAYKRLQQYTREHGLNPGNTAVEIYLNDPKRVASKEIQTEVLIQLQES